MYGYRLIDRQYQDPPGSELLQLLLSDELLPERELALVLRLLEALPRLVDVTDHLALLRSVGHLER